ncbi:hypothetical protein HS088_TW07G00797 [Tripterygium wilfordii]|uniref:RING-CH-type domain-containing protein n=1 Tax=Tripterygium wilfordii TaxID=458696 RepID=A0A7J7DG32_TRIWF|nr:uncharacterized protein LOC120001893 [Tripterygium wilfordii]KAF5745214.1 hypothetical protein HS088_TW07G00797 [Tripterygium wilfordii]
MCISSQVSKFPYRIVLKGKKRKRGRNLDLSGAENGINEAGAQATRHEHWTHRLRDTRGDVLSLQFHNLEYLQSSADFWLVNPHSISCFFPKPPNLFLSIAGRELVPLLEEIRSPSWFLVKEFNFVLHCFIIFQSEQIFWGIVNSSMGDHFVLLVDRLLTESTLEAAIESRKRSLQATSSAVDERKDDNISQKVDFGDILAPGKLVECRICQEEDEDLNMETPCSCCGSLKYAHRRCVQRWCDEKGNTICEICQQEFKHGYTAPTPLFQFGRVPIHFRGNWDARRGLRGPRYMAMVSTNHNLSEYEDYSASTTRNLICCPSVAVIFTVLLILRHTLPMFLSETDELSFPLFVLLFLRIAGIVIPVYVMTRAVIALQRHRRQLEPANPPLTSMNEAAENSNIQPHIIHFG